MSNLATLPPLPDEASSASSFANQPLSSPGLRLVRRHGEYSAHRIEDVKGTASSRMRVQVSESLSRIIDATGWSQQKLAERSGWCRRHVRNLIHCRVGITEETLNTVEKLLFLVFGEVSE